MNADATDTNTGNINCVDAKPSSTFADGADDLSLQFDDSIRFHMLDNSLTETIGTLEWHHFISVRQKLGKFSTKLSDLMLLMDSISYHKALTLPEFKKLMRMEETQLSIQELYLIWHRRDLFLPESFLTTIDGTVSKAASNNTKGGFIYLYKPTVQYGFGQDLEIRYIIF